MTSYDHERPGWLGNRDLGFCDEDLGDREENFQYEHPRPGDREETFLTK